MSECAAALVPVEAATMDLGGEDWSPLEVSLANVPRRDRIAVFHEVLGRKLIGMDYAPVPGAPLIAELTMRRLPGLTVVTGVAGATVNRRTRELLADGQDGFGLAIVVGGGAWRVSAGGREEAENTSQACLSSFAEPSISISTSPSRILAVNISRSALMDRIRHVDDLTLRPIASDNQALRLLCAYLGELEREQVLRAEGLRRAVANHVHDLVALTVGASEPASRLTLGRGVAAARLKVIKAFLTRHLTRHDLTVHGVAARHHMTERHLQRLFEAEGQTFSGFLLDARLAHARRLLIDPARATEKVATVAFDCGFGDISYFNRTFRRAFGMTPSEVRAAAG